MHLTYIFLTATLAVAAAKPYGVKGGYDRDSDRLVQSHIPVNEDINAERLEPNQGRKITRPVVHGYGGEQPVRGGRGELVLEDRVVSGGYGGRKDVRPISEGYGGRKDVGPISGGYGEFDNRREPLGGHIEGRPMGGGYGESDLRPIGGGYGGSHLRPIDGGYGERNVRPIGGGYGESNLRPIGGGYRQGPRVEGIGHNSHLETEELSGNVLVNRPQQIGGVKGGQQRQIGY